MVLPRVHPLIQLISFFVALAICSKVFLNFVTRFVSKWSDLMFLELTAGEDACRGVKASLGLHNSCTLILDCASLDPFEFIVDKSYGDIWSIFTIYKFFRCF